jgi:transposase-like protein
LAIWWLFFYFAERRAAMDWKRIRAEYIAGDTSYRKLAEKYGVSFNTLKTRAIEEQWYKQRQQKEHRTATKIVESLSNKEVQTVIGIMDVADQLLAKISELINTVPVESQAIKQLTSALKDLRDIKGIKTEADMREQDARIRNLEKQLQGEDASSRVITINLGDGLDKFSK